MHASIILQLEPDLLNDINIVVTQFCTVQIIVAVCLPLWKFVAIARYVLRLN